MTPIPAQTHGSLGVRLPRERLNGGGFDGGEFGHFDANLSAFARLASNIHFELVAVKQAQAFVDIADPDAAFVNFFQPCGRHSHPLVDP